MNLDSSIVISTVEKKKYFQRKRLTNAVAITLSPEEFLAYKKNLARER